MIKTKKIQFIILLTSFIYTSCGNDADISAKLLARVGDNYLYDSDITGLVVPGTNKSDSIQIVKAYTQKWINKQLILLHANDKVGETKDIEVKTQQFKNDLIIAEYEQTYLTANLDTTISQKQINDYFEQNKSAFELGDYVVNVFYMKFDVEEKNLEKIANEIKLTETYNDALVVNEKYSSIAVNSLADAGSWIFLNDLLKEIPLQPEDKTSFLQKTSFIQLSDENYSYFVRIFDYKLKNETSPISLAASKIKSMILRQRSQKLLDALHQKIIKENSSSADIENYVK